MNNDNLTYSQCVEELEVILKTLENSDEVDMDTISLKVKRAVELMDFCKKKLHVLDKSIEKMIVDL